MFHQAALASVPRSVDEPLGHARRLRDRHAERARRGPPRRRAARRVRRLQQRATATSRSPSKRETDLPAPLSPYAAAKLAGELYCQAFAASYGLETVVIRYFNVFGPRQDPNGEYSAVIPEVRRRRCSPATGRRSSATGCSRATSRMSRTSCRATCRGGDPAAAGRVFNVACGRQFNLLELVAAINRVLGTKIEPIFEPARAGDVRDSLADITAAREVLGYEPTIDFDEGLRRSIEYYRSLM